MPLLSSSIATKQSMPICELDHIVIGAASLAEGVRFVRERLGVDIPPGGKHPLMSTHNHLMRLGSSAFLEVIAIDPDAPAPQRRRWFDMDDPAMRTRLAKGPHIITWVVRSPDIIAAQQASAYPLPAVINARRDALSWRMTVAEDGRIPGEGALPHVIQWDGGARPWERMADTGCSLDAFVITHPDPAMISAGLRSIGAAGLPGVVVEMGPAPALGARVVTPSGAVATL
jgi:hypothetical protein